MRLMEAKSIRSIRSLYKRCFIMFISCLCYRQKVFRCLNNHCCDVDNVNEIEVRVLIVIELYLNVHHNMVPP